MKWYLILSLVPLAIIVLLSSISFAQENVPIYWNPFSQDKPEIYSENNRSQFCEDKSIKDMLEISYDDLFTTNPVQLRDVLSGKISAEDNLKPLFGCRRELLRGSKAIGHLNPNERIEVTLIMRSEFVGAQFAAIENAMDANCESTRAYNYLSRQEFAEASAPSQDAPLK